MSQTNVECHECGALTDVRHAACLPATALAGRLCDECMERVCKGLARLRADHERLLVEGVHPDIASRRLCVSVARGEYDEPHE